MESNASSRKRIPVEVPCTNRSLTLNLLRGYAKYASPAVASRASMHLWGRGNGGPLFNTEQVATVLVNHFQCPSAATCDTGQGIFGNQHRQTGFLDQ